MQGIILILLIILPLATPAAQQAKAGMQSYSALPGSAGASGGTQVIDGIAARIDDDIITESEVRELAAFQALVDGHAKPRADLIQELADQWIVRGEASVAKYPEPSAADVDRAYAGLVKQFPSQQEFESRCAADGLSEAALRKLLGQQLFLSRFLDFRFRPAAQVDDQQIAAFYKNEFAPRLRERGQTIPPLADVEDTIREVLVQRTINERATAWLDDTRNRLKIDVLPEGAAP